MARTGTTWARRGRVRRGLMLPLAVLLVAGLAACGSDAASSEPDPAAGGSGPGPSAGTPDGEFLSTSVTENGKPKKLVKGTSVSLRFADGAVSAQAGCNTMSGPVRFADGKLVVDDLAMTEMGCPGEGRHEQDQFVAAFLTARPAYTYDGTTLDLSTDSVRMVFGPREQVQPDLPLEGTRWNVTHLTSGPARDAADDPNAAVSAGMAPPKAFLEFADGRVTGNDGCNRLFGDATVSGDTITFGPIATTKMACPGVEGTDRVLAVLTGDVTWKIDHRILTLTNAAGDGLQLEAEKMPAGDKKSAPGPVGNADS
ncbi:META domain-containing protein [Sporichthya polymorpha]|uniref:META domain-containing protein n=1 Tax=Sporichthya polymorpha TaxID=35751 RepID=UPI0009FD4C2B|nr:META domain-containing protein [Sporichthya polymorpha]